MAKLALGLVALVAFAGLASAVSLKQDFEEFRRFQLKFAKVYASDAERNQRFQVFRENLREIEQHNQQPNASYKKGINQFADLTAEEFKNTHLGGYVKTDSGHGSNGLMSSTLPLLKSMSPQDALKGLPQNVDWREKGIISPVKNQAHCGSCWAFTTIEQVESYIALATGNLTTLSVQELVSCMPNVLECGGTGGCFGATCEMAYNWIQAFGLVSDSVLPYESGKSGKTGECGLDVDNMERIAFVRGYETLMHNDMMATVTHLANVGPLGIALDASAFHLYESGVFDACDYDQNIEINHGVQLVGYGSNDFDGHYWIIRNSWGEGYGEQGYIRLRMDQGSEAPCGIDNTPAIGIKCKGDGFNQQKVCGRCGLLFAPSYPIGAMTSAHIAP